MFIAIDKKNGNRVNILDFSNPRLEIEKDSLVCQKCEQPLFIKAGMVRRHHFAHYSICESDYESHPESVEHIEAKILVANLLRKEFSEYTIASIDYEVRVPEVMRIADIMITFPMGWRVAHEIQLSSITIEDLQKRTSDYARSGIDVVWWLGKSADTETNRNWCLENFGVSYSLDVDKVRDTARSPN